MQCSWNGFALHKVCVKTSFDKQTEFIFVWKCEKNGSKYCIPFYSSQTFNHISNER